MFPTFIITYIIILSDKRFSNLVLHPNQKIYDLTGDSVIGDLVLSEIVAVDPYAVFSNSISRTDPREIKYFNFNSLKTSDNIKPLENNRDSGLEDGELRYLSN